MSAPARDYSVFESELSGRTFDGRLLWRLLGWLRPHRRAVTQSALLVLAASALAVLAPVVISRVAIDGILHPSGGLPATSFGMGAATHWLAAATQLPPLAAACVLYALLMLGWAVLAHLHRVLLAKAVLGGLRDLRRDLFVHMEHRPSSFYDRVAVGRVMTRITNDIETLFQLLAGFGILVGELVPFGVALGVMFAISPRLAGLLLVAVPVVAVATWLYRRATRKLYRDIRNSVSALNQNLQENLSGIQVVQLHGRERHNLARYMEINEQNRRSERAAISLETLYGPFTGSMAATGIGLVVWFGGREVLEGLMTLGSVVLFTQYVDMLFRPIVVLGEQYNVLYRAMASGERIFQALDWDEQLAVPKHPTPLPARLAGRVEFRRLTYGYRSDQPVLHDVSFAIEPGETVAIVGPTGSGKTTLIRLLCRFYDFGRGQILLDGIDLCDVDPRALRRRIGVVLQDFHIFSGSVRDNIALGEASVDDGRVEDAARLVHADRFIRSLPRGYDSPLTERGGNLSHGQRQLLSFARVIATDPEILILDEATASIDTETEQLIQDALRRVTAGRTSILIAHRLQTIREADRIVVLQQGRVREIGTHEELLARRGLYWTLHEFQFQNGDVPHAELAEDDPVDGSDRGASSA